MNILAFTIIFASFCCICMGAERYAGRIKHSLKIAPPQVLRLTGLGLLPAAVAACVAANGLSIGIGMFFGLASVASGLVMLFMAYLPKALPKAAALIVLAGMSGAFVL